MGVPEGRPPARVEADDAGTHEQTTTRATIPTTTATTTLPSSASTSAAASVISAGWWHSCGVRVDGGVVCWGLNEDWEGNYRGQADAPSGVFVAA